MRRAFLILLSLCFLVALPRAADAQDLLLMPYLGFTFASGSSLFADLEKGSGETASLLGGSVALLGGGIFGVEGDIAYVPGFFERGEQEIVVPGSFVTSLTGTVMLTLPLSVTRESLRPVRRRRRRRDSGRGAGHQVGFPDPQHDAGHHVRRRRDRLPLGYRRGPVRPPLPAQPG